MIAEIICFTSSESQGYSDIAKIFNHANGIQKAFHGRQIEDPTKVVWVNVWDTLEHHNAFVEDTSAAPLFESLKLPDKTSLSTMQARLADPFIDILSAPVTELFTVTLKPGHAMAELRPIMADLTSELKKGVAKGSHGSSWGPSVEKPEGVLIGIGGWDSTAAHWEAIQVKSLADVISAIRGVAVVDLMHVNLKLYTPGA